MVIRLFGRMTAYAFAVETEEGVTFERVVCDAREREAGALHVTAVTSLSGLGARGFQILNQYA